MNSDLAPSTPRPHSIGKALLWILLLSLFFGALAFGRQVYTYYKGIQSGDINPVFDRAFDSTSSGQQAATHVSKSDLMLLESKDAPSIGSKDAPVVLVEFLDYGCPFCRRSFQDVRQLVTDRPDDVRLIIRDFPIELLHPGATKVAMAARCVNEIDPSKFWSYHDKLFLQPTTKTEELLSYAQSIGVERKALATCLETERTRRLVEQDIALGLQTGVQGTPTFFFNGRRVQGSLDREAFDAIIDWMKKHPTK